MTAKADSKVELLPQATVSDANVDTPVPDRLVNNFGEVDEEDIVNKELEGDDESVEESDAMSEPEDLSDLFDTDSEVEMEEKVEKPPLYLDTLAKLYPKVDEEEDDFETHLRQISAASRTGGLAKNDVKVEDLDEIDKIFLRADSLLNKKRR